jgi:hypothetical protein
MTQQRGITFSRLVTKVEFSLFLSSSFYNHLLQANFILVKTHPRPIHLRNYIFNLHRHIWRLSM